MYQDSPESPQTDAPSGRAVIAKLPSPICLPQPQPQPLSPLSFRYGFRGAGDASSGGGGSGLCTAQERQSMFAFNVSALNPGHVIVGVVTNDSRISKYEYNSILYVQYFSTFAC